MFDGDGNIGLDVMLNVLESLILACSTRDYDHRNVNSPVAFFSTPASISPEGKYQPWRKRCQ